MPAQSGCLGRWLAICVGLHTSLGGALGKAGYFSAKRPFLAISSVSAVSLRTHDDRPGQRSRRRPPELPGPIPGTYVGCIFGKTQLTNYYRSNHLPRGWPCKDPINLTAQNGMKTILAIGDSITAGKDVSQFHNYVYLLRERLRGQLNVNVVNLGVHGATVLPVRGKQYGHSPQYRVAHNPESKFDVAIIQLGTNDGIYWNSASFITQYLNFVKPLMDGHPRAKFILSVPPPVAPENAEHINHTYINNELPKAIRSVKDYLASDRVSVVEMPRAYARSTATAEKTQRKSHVWLTSSDGVHPTKDGYKVIADAMAAQVRATMGLAPQPNERPK